MTNRGVHILDAMVAFLGPIAKVLANVENIAVGTLQATTPYWSMKIYGTEATLEMCGEERLVFHPRGGKATICDFQSRNLELAVFEAFANAVSGVASYRISTGEILALPIFLGAAIQSAETAVLIVLK